MSVSLGYLSHAEKEKQNVHKLVHAHRRCVSIAIGAHKALIVHIKKPKIFKEMRTDQNQTAHIGMICYYHLFDILAKVCRANYSSQKNGYDMSS